MDKRALLDRHTSDAEERLVLSQVLDRAQAARQRQTPECTAFLTPREQLSAQGLLRAAGESRFLALGGYDDAERRVLLFLPDWLEPEFADEGEYLSLVRCTWFREDKLTHRDLLGALMGMGVRRDTVGDILVGEDSCDLMVLPTIAPFLRDNMTSAGRVRVQMQLLPLSEVRLPQQARKQIRDTVATLRLDSVLAVGFSMSRSKATQFISAGRVEVNWQDTSKSDFSVKEGDVISCRGLGKCRLTEVGGLSRKGRYNITVERYL